MNRDQFERIFEHQLKQTTDVLIAKREEYAPDDDVLHNFTAAAALIGGTPEQALWGFLTKHLISLSDMVRDEHDIHDVARWEEKIGDSINYLFLLRAIIWQRAVDDIPALDLQITKVLEDLNNPR